MRQLIRNLPLALLLGTLTWVLMQVTPLIAATADIEWLSPELAASIRAVSHLAWLAGAAWLLIACLSSKYASANRIHTIHWEKFEQLVADVYRRNGYRVVARGKAGADGGVDFRAIRRGKQYIVQCKRWSKRVGVPVVREMAGLLATERRVSGVIIVTNNDFTREAIAFAEGKSIELVNGAELQRMMRARRF
jgi:hypothetical protein